MPVSKHDLITYAAYASLALFLARVLWPEFTALVRMVWRDVIAAAQALAGSHRNRR